MLWISLLPPSTEYNATRKCVTRNAIVFVWTRQGNGARVRFVISFTENLLSGYMHCIIGSMLNGIL